MEEMEIVVNLEGVEEFRKAMVRLSGSPEEDYRWQECQVEGLLDKADRMQGREATLARGVGC